MLRFLLAVVLSLHVGFSQAAIAQVAHAEHSVAQAQAPCHGAAATDAPQDETRTSVSHDCCDAGNCHCAGIGGVAAPLIALIARHRGETRRIPAQPVLVLSLAPDLRPPIC